MDAFDAIDHIAGSGTRPELKARRRILTLLMATGTRGSTRSEIAGRKDYRTGASQFDKFLAEGLIEKAPWPPDADGRTAQRWRLSDAVIELVTTMTGQIPGRWEVDSRRLAREFWKKVDPECEFDYPPEPEVETFWNQQPDLDPEPVSTHESFWNQPDPEPDSTTESFWECHDPDCHDPDRPNLKSDDLEDCTR